MNTQGGGNNKEEDDVDNLNLTEQHDVLYNFHYPAMKAHLFFKKEKFPCILNTRKSFQVKGNSFKMASTVSFSSNIYNSWEMNKIPKAEDS